MVHLYIAHPEIKKRVEERFKCRTPRGNRIKPHKIEVDIYGNRASYVEDDFRYWGFVSRQGRDKFAEDFQAEKL